MFITLKGSWEKKLIERIHNVAKTGKRPNSEPTTSAPKRRRPKGDNPIIQRYLPLLCDDEAQDHDQEQALKKEEAKERSNSSIDACYISIQTLLHSHEIFE